MKYVDLAEIADDLNVDETLRAFSEDSTGDNAVEVVRAVLNCVATRPTQWEYMVREPQPANTDDPMAEALALLNELGAQGWEMCFANERAAFFKRVKQ